MASLFIMLHDFVERAIIKLAFVKQLIAKQLMEKISYSVRWVREIIFVLPASSL